MAGIVPAFRQRAVRIPIKIKVIRIFRAVRIPSRHMTASSFAENPLLFPYTRKIKSPIVRAYNMEYPEKTQTSRQIQNKRMVNDIGTLPPLVQLI